MDDATTTTTHDKAAGPMTAGPMTAGPMTAEERGRFGEKLRGLFPRSGMTTDLYAAWDRDARAYPLAVAVAALLEHRRTHKFNEPELPTFRRLCEQFAAKMVPGRRPGTRRLPVHLEIMADAEAARKAGAPVYYAFHGVDNPVNVVFEKFSTDWRIARRAMLDANVPKDGRDRIRRMIRAHAEQAFARVEPPMDPAEVRDFADGCVADDEPLPAEPARGEGGPAAMDGATLEGPATPFQAIKGLAKAHLDDAREGGAL